MEHILGIKRIVVFTGALSQHVCKGIVEIDKAIPGATWLILLSSPKQAFPRRLRSQWLHLRREGWRRIPAVASEVRQRLLARTPGPVPAGSPGSEFTALALKARHNLQIKEVPDIHAQSVLEDVQDFEPDLGLSLAAPILRRSLFAIPRLGTLNLHKGKVPDYRGMPPAFWELWNNENTVGCTVHWVEDRLDTGPVVAATSIERERYSTVKGLQLRLNEVGVEMMRDVVGKLARGETPSAPQESGGTTYRKPTLRQEAELARRISQLQPSGPPLAKRFLKEAAKATTYNMARLGLRRATPPRATVLLYHRVTDTVRDNLTVGIEQFDRHLAMLRQHFQIVTLSDLLSWRVVPRTCRPIVCVTFDDGYLDNYVNAAPLLMRHEIPATFFVSTGIVGTDRRFPHDVRRGNAPIPVMQWDHLRKLRDAGFLIGSHTVNHIDCAAESEDVVRAELEQSRDDLQRELGLQDIIFSYPYGGRRHMTPERLELVKQVGYVGCVSAYGGSNVGTIDSFNILRTGCHWEFSDRAFLAKSIGYW